MQHASETEGMMNTDATGLVRNVGLDSVVRACSLDGVQRRNRHLAATARDLTRWSLWSYIFGSLSVP